MYYSWMGLCSGHGTSVVIRELSLYPKSLLAKLTLQGQEHMTCITCVRFDLLTFQVFFSNWLGSCMAEKD